MNLAILRAPRCALRSAAQNQRTAFRIGPPPRRYCHPLQSSGALGAAAAQLGPDAQAAVVELNKQGGLSHGKVSRCLGILFGIPLSRGGSAHVVLQAASPANR